MKDVRRAPIRYIPDATYGNTSSTVSCCSITQQAEYGIDDSVRIVEVQAVADRNQERFMRVFYATALTFRNFLGDMIILPWGTSRRTGADKAAQER